MPRFSRVRERFNDFSRAFWDITQEAVNRHVDFMVIAGDLFHKRAIDARKCLLGSAKSPMKQAEIVVRFRQAGVQRNGFFVVGLRFLEPVRLLEANAAPCGNSATSCWGLPGTSITARRPSSAR